MHSTFAFGLAKNGVNGLPSVRRAATASQIGGCLSTPSSPVNAESGGAGWSNEGEETAAASSAPRTAMSRVVLSPIAFSDLSVEEEVPSRTATTCSTGHDLHLSKRGTSVDKTNPFIGYFQTGTEEEDNAIEPAPGTAISPMPPLAVPIRRVPCRAQSSAALSSMSSFYPSTFFTQQKQTKEWPGSQSSRLSLFLKQKYAELGKQQKRAVHLESLKLEKPALAGQAITEERYEKKQHKTLFKRTASLPSTMSAMTPAVALSPVISLSSKAKMSPLALDSCTSKSRFEQDFEVVGSLGKGGQGSVYKVRSKVDGCYYAVKKVFLPRATELNAKRAESQALREVRLMASMPPHFNVIRYHTAWTEVDACARPTSSSTESVSGSDIPSLGSCCDFQDVKRQQMNLLDEEAEVRTSSMKSAGQSFSLEFSADSFAFDEYSTPGFTFEDESLDKSSVGLCVDDEASFGQLGELKNEVKINPSDPAELVIMKSQVILYIQMELCGTARDAVSSFPAGSDNHEPIHRILDQLKTPQQERQQYGEEMHSNLGAWLRSSFEERSLWSNTSEKHQEGLKLFFGAVQGVAHMHSNGVIHRDLKPDNIFIHGDVAKIGDFGLSKSVFADSTVDGGVSPRECLRGLGLSDGDHTTALGTFTYASPEQLGYRFSSSDALKNAATRLKSAKYSIKSDIFALGVILLELCCPFSTMMERSQVLTGVRHGVVPQKARQHFPAEMNLVLRMTSIDPDERPTSGEVCEQLHKIMATSSATITPASALEELRELQTKIAAAVRLLRDRSQATLQLETLVSELNDKVQDVGIALA